jgi:hypothetical protein
VGHQLRAWAAGRDPRAELSTWRTSAGQEVDFVIEAGRRILPIEVKATTRPVGNDLRGPESFLGLHPEARLGVLACACAETQAVSSTLKEHFKAARAARARRARPVPIASRENLPEWRRCLT